MVNNKLPGKKFQIALTMEAPGPWSETEARRGSSASVTPPRSPTLLVLTATFKVE